MHFLPTVSGWCARAWYDRRNLSAPMLEDRQTALGAVLHRYPEVYGVEATHFVHTEVAVPMMHVACCRSVLVVQSGVRVTESL